MNDYWLLFSSGFISSTLFPGGSEVLFIYYLQQQLSLKWEFFFAVTIGNSLGAVVTYLLGYYINFGQEKAALKYPKTLLFCQKWGNVALLLSWLPIVGDVICLFAGWLKLSRGRAFINIVIGKSLRYLFLMFLFLIFP
ncbi:YqaA family protein [Psychromonas sp. SR45-3]|uniref:YqaA family protein n=1 Tax=Psychromonas sp. SR45-3 TaxID=2760930 RepID=UPI0015FCFCFB|nr:DedA family protein [Psychromonas sp. SR45-3]MBB1273666.1 DedA family protein [Psychromonas sp. SR45-3]